MKLLSQAAMAVSVAGLMSAAGMIALSGSGHAPRAPGMPHLPSEPALAAGATLLPLAGLPRSGRPARIGLMSLSDPAPALGPALAVPEPPALAFLDLLPERAAPHPPAPAPLLMAEGPRPPMLRRDAQMRRTADYQPPRPDPHPPLMALAAVRPDPHPPLVAVAAARPDPHPPLAAVAAARPDPHPPRIPRAPALAATTLAAATAAPARPAVNPHPPVVLRRVAQGAGRPAAPPASLRVSGDRFLPALLEPETGAEVPAAPAAAAAPRSAGDLTDPEVLKVLAAMTPEQIEALALLLAASSDGGAARSWVDARADAARGGGMALAGVPPLPGGGFGGTGAPEPVAVSTVSEEPSVENILLRGWRAQETAEGQVYIQRHDDPLTRLDIETGLILGPFGRVERIVRAAPDLWVELENGEEIRGRANPNRAPRPKPRPKERT